jgi:hypothetical protein
MMVSTPNRRISSNQACTGASSTWSAGASDEARPCRERRVKADVFQVRDWSGLLVVVVLQLSIVGGGVSFVALGGVVDEERIGAEACGGVVEVEVNGAWAALAVDVGAGCAKEEEEADLERKADGDCEAALKTCGGALRSARLVAIMVWPCDRWPANSLGVLAVTGASGV